MWEGWHGGELSEVAENRGMPKWGVANLLGSHTNLKFLQSNS